MTDQGRIYRSQTSTLFVALVAAALTFSHIHQGTLGVDAIRYASISRNILETGRWFPLYDSYTEAVYYNKPPVLFWMVASCFKLLGYSTFAARLTGAAFAFAGILLLWNSMLSLYGERIALFSVLMLAANADFFRSIVDLNFEGILLCAGVLLLHAGLNRVRRGRFVRGDRVRISVAVFLILMTKPPVILYAVPAFIFFDWTAQPGGEFIRNAGRRLVRWGLICAACIGLALIIAPPDFVIHTLARQLLEPFIFTESYPANLALWLKNIFLFLAPASLIGLAALIFPVKNGNRSITLAERRFLYLWLLPIAGVVLATESRTRYLHIPFLSLAVLGGEFLAVKCSEIGFKRTKLFLLLGAPAMWLAVICGLPLHGSDAVIKLFSQHPELIDSSPIVCAGGSLNGDIFAPSVKRLQMLIRFTFNRSLNVVPPQQLEAAATQYPVLIVANRKCLEDPEFPHWSQTVIASGPDAEALEVNAVP